MTEDNIPISYVTVYDTAKHQIIGFTDVHGFMKLNYQPKTLKFTHVTFEDKYLSVSDFINDTVQLYLSLKQKVLETVITSNVTIDKRRFYQTGTYYRNTSSGFIFRGNNAIGYKVEFDPLANGTSYLRSIKFVLGNVASIDKPDVIIEIKIYAILENGYIGAFPLNTVPIYIKAADLKRKNQIFIKETIKIPNEGFFLSFQLPLILDIHYDWTIMFKGSNNSETPYSYNMSNKKESWDEDILLKKGIPPLPNAGYFKPQLSITFWKLKN